MVGGYGMGWVLRWYWRWLVRWVDGLWVVVVMVVMVVGRWLH